MADEELLEPGEKVFWGRMRRSAEIIAERAKMANKEKWLPEALVKIIERHKP